MGYIGIASSLAITCEIMQMVVLLHSISCVEIRVDRGSSEFVNIGESSRRR